MPTEHRAFLSRVMTFAWGSFRADPARSFADCLKGAWRFCRRGQKAAQRLLANARANGGVVRFSNDLTCSPIRARLRGQRYAGAAAFNATYLTARLGS